MKSKYMIQRVQDKKSSLHTKRSRENLATWYLIFVKLKGIILDKEIVENWYSITDLLIEIYFAHCFRVRVAEPSGTLHP